MQKNRNITIADVADALGVSKTTVSRALSGKGRISDATREKVRAYIEESGYQPNIIAKGLAQSRTFNLCVVMPGDYALVDLPFFQEALTGIQEVACEYAYDILLCICQENDISNLQRIIQNGKVDAVVLLRTFVEDPQITFLEQYEIPFVTVGNPGKDTVVQVDHDHESACKELAAMLIRQGNYNITILGGSEKIVANRSRLHGIQMAMEEASASVDWKNEKEYSYGSGQNEVYINLNHRKEIDTAVEQAVAHGTDCILCLDDAICSRVLLTLRQKNLQVGTDVKVASCYNSSVLENNIPSITSLSFDAGELGKKACEIVLEQIAGNEVSVKTLLPYHLILGDSTK